MVRVCKPNGHSVLITHGCPKKRLSEIDSYECRKDIDVDGKKIHLSDLAQLINVLRSELKDKPLSYAFKNKDQMVKAMKEGTICSLLMY